MPARDWFHQFIEPWVHYIPVATDLSDLEERWRWAETHPEQAQRIAAAGAYVGQNKPPRSASQDFAAALEAARVPVLHAEHEVAKKFPYCHYGPCNPTPCNGEEK
jgi:ABC-type nitrate/sulfonate/bicarbonate transport system substrate-binding protein